MPDNAGFFQLNDIALHIPPSQITVGRESVNHHWQTLRTRSSIKTKSGFSSINVQARVTFTSTSKSVDGISTNGFQQLRDIIAQVRTTPFCYVENQYLRNAILGGSPEPSMVLALKQMQIIKGQESTNTIEVIFYFCWFNYFPFMREWLYKTDFFTPTATTNPASSLPWKVMYSAEKARGDSRGLYHAPPKLGTDYGHMGFTQFATLTVKRYLELDKDYVALRELEDKVRQELKIAGDSSKANVGTFLARELAQSRGTERAKVLKEEIFGHVTSQLPEDITLEQVLKVLDSTLGVDSGSPFILTDRSIWTPTFTNKGKGIISKDRPQASRRKLGEADGDDILLLERERRLDLNARDTGLIVTGITISFENILAILPLMGHAYPTYQHIGSIDANVSISMTTTSEAALAAVSAFYSTVEDQGLKFKQIPQGHRNIQLVNELVNMCGLLDFIPNSLTSETVPGEPGTYRIALELINNPLTANTTEAIQPGPSFTTRMDIRNLISEILLNNLRFEKTRFKDKTLLQQIAGHVHLGKYVFAPKSGSTSGTRGQAFRDLCESYADELTKVYLKLLNAFGTTTYFHDTKTPEISEFYALSNDDIPGISRLQEDVFDIIKRYKSPITSLGNPSSLSGARNIAKETIDRSRDLALKKVQSFEELRRKQSNPNSTFAKLSEVVRNAEKENFDRVKSFTDDHMDDWLEFSIPFLDKILYSGFTNLEQFKGVRAALNEKAQGSSGTCYPDFPLKQVVQMMENSDHAAMQQAIEELRKAADKGDFGLKNIGISALLQPDFYMYSTQGDELENILPHRMTRAAADSVIESQQRVRLGAEKSWVNDEYEAKIVGTDIANQIREDANNVTFDRSLWKSKEKEELKTAIEDLQQISGGDFHFNDLQDVDGGGLGCSILTEATTGKDPEPIPLQDMSPSSFAIGGKGRTPGSMVLRNRSGASLNPNFDHHGKIRHKFGTNSIDFQSSSSSIPTSVSAQTDPNQMPDWTTPVPPSFRINSPFGPRTPPLGGASSDHQGIDLVNSLGGSTVGAPVYAAADGEIVRVNKVPYGDSPIEDKRNGTYYNGNFIKIKHSGGYYSWYLHLDNSGETEQTRNRFYLTEGGRKYRVSKGDIIGRVGGTGNVTGPHLHFITTKNGTPVDPVKVLDNSLKLNQGPTVGLDDVNESLLTKSVQQLEKDIKNGQGYSLMRAYPTFRLYFIESDLGERRRFGFDDFFSYSAVQDIQVIRSRKIPADLAVITLTNVSGALSNRKFRNSLLRDAQGNVFDGKQAGAIAGGQVTTESPGDPTRTNTPDENPIESLMLKPGQQIQLRLGYNNHPDELETVMNGVITDVAFKDTDDMVTIYCQSFAVEMVQNQWGEVKTFGGFLSNSGRTGKMLEELLSMPEVVHFGRWEGGKATNSSYGILRNEWNFVPSPQDDNIFAPRGRGIWGLFDSTPKYVLYQSTIWDVFQEMTLRHPAYVAYPVPYEGKWGPRMTMFFGVPDQQYFARDPTFKEDNVTEGLTKFVTDSVENLRNNRSDIDKLADPYIGLQTDKPGYLSQKVKSDIDNGTTPLAEVRAFWLKNQIKNYALHQGFVKPFRNYHIATSTQHILLNNIEASGNIFNTVTLQYGDDAAEVDDGELKFGDLETFTLRADAAVQDEDVREMFAQYKNCLGYEMAKRYAVGLLFYAMKENYKGNLVLVGNPKIKPYDIIYVFDEYSDMFGPVEVEQVIHRMSQKNGFVSEVTPDMVVHVNQDTTLSTSDAMGLMAESALRRIGLQSLPSLMTKTNQAAGSGALAIGAGLGASAAPLAASAAAIGSGALAFNIAFTPIANMFFNSSEHALSQGSSTSPFGMMGAFIFRKLITRSQLAHPFRYSPLVKGGHAMAAGLPIKKNKGSFVQGIKTWAREADEGIGMMLSDLYEDIRPDNWFGRSQGDFRSLFEG